LSAVHALQDEESVISAAPHGLLSALAALSAVVSIAPREPGKAKTFPAMQPESFLAESFLDLFPFDRAAIKNIDPRPIAGKPETDWRAPGLNQSSPRATRQQPEPSCADGEPWPSFTVCERPGLSVHAMGIASPLR
jgi:hypothetical protein